MPLELQERGQWHNSEMSRNKNVGNAGEFYVLAQLAQRGYIAGKTDDGQTLIDIIATDSETLKSVNIQVKTTRDGRNIPEWIMNIKNEQVHKNLWYVLVEIKSEDLLPNFFIYHSNEIGPTLAHDHSEYQKGTKKDGSPRKDGPMRRYRPNAEELMQHKDNWGQMFN